MSIKDANIFIVEDEPQINRLIELVLLSDGYTNIDKFFDGLEAFEKIKEKKPDLVLLDVMLPSMDGFSVCKKIKSNSDLNNTQVIMLTARKMEEDILKGFENGAIDYVSKPFSNKILLARVKAHLQNTKLTKDIYEYNGITMDDSKKAVYTKNNSIELTNFEYRIFKIFLKNTGRVFSRAQLLEHLRGEDGLNVSERAVDVQILNLRRKLKDIADCIETIRGVGYRLKDAQV